MVNGLLKALILKNMNRILIKNQLRRAFMSINSFDILKQAIKEDSYE